jgi:hypothetical protein
MHAVFPVIAGLAVGIALLAVASMVFPPYHDYTPRPGIHAKEAVRIASEDGTLQDLIEDLYTSMRTSRDFGVAGPDCPPYWCAIVLVYDRSDPKTAFYAVNVNVRDEKVVGIYIHQDLLIAQTKENEEVKAFLSRYPDADAEVQVGPDGKTVTYSKSFRHAESEDPKIRTLSVTVKTTYSGQTISTYAQCGSEKVASDVLEFVGTTDCLEP